MSKQRPPVEEALGAGAQPLTAFCQYSLAEPLSCTRSQACWQNSRAFYVVANSPHIDTRSFVSSTVVDSDGFDGFDVRKKGSVAAGEAGTSLKCSRVSVAITCEIRSRLGTSCFHPLAF